MSLDTQYTLRGRVLNGRIGDPAPGLTVMGFDYDISRDDDRLGEVTTEADGTFELQFKGSDAGGRGESVPEPYVIIRAEDEKHLLQTPYDELLRGETTLDFGDLFVSLPADDEGAGGAEYEGKEEDGRDGEKGGKARPPAPHGSKAYDRSPPRSPLYQGRFGRLFRELDAWVPPGASDQEKMQVLGELSRLMQEPEGTADEELDHESMSAAYTYFGQFVDHDITFDPASSLQRKNDPDKLINFRTPRFDLDNLYGGGPSDEPFLFDRRSGHEHEFAIGKGRQVPSRVRDEDIQMSQLRATTEDDLPRSEQGIALIGDPRNDENLIVAQMQLAMLTFHNAVLRWVKEREELSGRDAYERARALVRWHYQWVVLTDFLPRLVGYDLASEVLFGRENVLVEGESLAEGAPFEISLKHYGWKNAPFIPVEFSVAAYRLGHSMIRPTYDLNRVVRRVPIFEPPSSTPGALDDLRGGRPLPGRWSLDWRMYLDLSGNATPQRTRRIDTRLNHKLSKIPAGPGGENALAFLNLMRGWRMELPSGQAIARAMGRAPISNGELGLDAGPFGSEAPLWYYVLKEAEIAAGGQHLGPVGGRIVAEVFAGLAKGDPHSFLSEAPDWRPGDTSLIEPMGARFELRDVLRFAGLDREPF